MIIKGRMSLCLREIFTKKNGKKKIVVIPRVAIDMVQKISEISGAQDLCIAGGFLRGLYMRQVLGLSPQMNDIDVFADMSEIKYLQVKDDLEAVFGKPVRFHIGTFDQEEFPRGLVEFLLPQIVSKKCGGVKTIQLNFGQNHPWACPDKYIETANININRIAAGVDGEVQTSSSFIHDMKKRKLAMNPERAWSLYDWERTMATIYRMRSERPEFKDWRIIQVAKPEHRVCGTFWKTCTRDSLEP